jgi:hypothetical protein
MMIMSVLQRQREYQVSTLMISHQVGSNAQMVGMTQVPPQTCPAGGQGSEGVHGALQGGSVGAWAGGAASEEDSEVDSEVDSAEE